MTNNFEINKELIIDDINMNIKGLKMEIANIETIKRKIENGDLTSITADVHRYLRMSERHMLARRRLYNISDYVQDMPPYIIHNDKNIELIKDTFEMEFTLEKEGWYRVILPQIPSKKAREKSKYFNETVFYFIKKNYQEMIAVSQNEIIKLTDATLVYIHHIDKNSPLKDVPDVDNIDQKYVTDVFASTIITSDQMHHLDILNLSYMGGKAYTEIYVIDQKDMGKWVSMHIGFFTKNRHL